MEKHGKTEKNIKAIIEDYFEGKDKPEFLNEDAFKGLVEELCAYQREYEAQNKNPYENAANRINSQIFFDESHTGYAICDTDLNIKSANKTFCGLIGKNPQTLRDKNITDLIARESEDIIHFLTKRLLENKKKSTGEINLKHSGGKSIPVKIECSIFDDYKDQTICIEVIDLTGEKEMKHALVESKTKFQAYIDFSPTPIFIADAEGNYKYFNAAGCGMLGYEFQEAIKLKIPDVTPEDKSSIEFEELKEKGSIHNLEKKFKHKNGTLIDVIIDAVKISENEYIAFCKDITERKIAVEALKQSERKFRTLFENMKEGFALHQIVTDDNGNPIDYLFLDLNPAFEKLTGLKREKTIGKKITEIMPGIEDEEANWVKRYGDVALMDKSISFEDYSEALNQWYLVSAYSPQKNQFAVIISNITDRKHAEHSLKESEKKFRALFENMSEGFALRKIIKDEQGNVVDYEYLDINPAYEKITGLKKDELINKRLTEIAHITDVQNLNFVEEYIEVGLTGKSTSFEEYSKTLNKWYYVSAYSPRKDHFAVIISDITKSKEAEQQIRKSEEKFRIINENSTVGIVLSDNKGNMEFSNHAFNDLLGYTSDEIARLHFSDFTHPRDLEEEIEFFNDLLNGKRDSYKIEKRYIRKDGSRVWVLVNISPVKDAGNKITNFVGVIENISDRKRAEKALVESQRLNAIGEMSSAIAHDFNNSLQLIFGNLELALLNTEEAHPSRRYLDTMKTATADAAARVQLLQRFGGKSKTVNNYQSINIREIINDVVTQSRPLWRDRALKEGLSINMETELKELYTHGNIGELRSALYNIVKNSIEAMPKGGTISITNGQKNGSLYIRVSDTGIGMNDETRQRVFQPFFSTKGFEPGRGMGLSSAYSIIKEHEGDIFIVDSTLGSGTTFEINLPSREPVSSTEKHTEPDIKKDKKIKILWVDDDKLIRDLALDIIRLLEIEGNVVASGAEALEYMERSKYDIVISDIGMPGMNGWDLAKKISEEYNSSVKIALVTGWGDQIDEDKKEEYGVDFVLTKPISIKQIEELIFGGH